MKRYLVFMGEGCYPYGGAQDFVIDVDTKEEIIELRENNLDKWVNCLDTETNQILCVIYDRGSSKYAFVTSKSAKSKINTKLSKHKRIKVQFKADAMENGSRIECLCKEDLVELLNEMYARGYMWKNGDTLDPITIDVLWKMSSTCTIKLVNADYTDGKSGDSKFLMLA